VALAVAVACSPDTISEPPYGAAPDSGEDGLTSADLDSTAPNDAGDAALDASDASTPGDAGEGG
jgi:hypothetical protein